MNKKQTNKLAMYLAVQQVCKKHQTVWNGLPIAVNLFAEFEAKIREIQGAARKQEEVQKGIREDKQALRGTLADKLEVIVSALTAYAHINQNHELAAKVRYQPSEFKWRDKEVIFKEKAEIVLDQAQQHLSQLADYGITDTHLAALTSDIDAFAVKLGAPRAAITARKEATTSIEQLVKHVDELLKNKFDHLMVQFKADPFYATYVSARTIVDLKRKQKKVGDEIVS